MTDKPLWTEGACDDGAAILRDGVMVRIEDVLARLNEGERLTTHTAALRSVLEGLLANGALDGRPDAAGRVRDALRGVEG